MVTFQYFKLPCIQCVHQKILWTASSREFMIFDTILAFLNMELNIVVSFSAMFLSVFSQDFSSTSKVNHNITVYSVCPYQVLLFPPNSQKHDSWCTGYAKLSWGVNECATEWANQCPWCLTMDWHYVKGCIPTSHFPGIGFGVSVPDQDKALTVDE